MAVKASHPWPANNSFQPSAEIRVVRTYWRQRGEHVRAASTCIQRIQKVLTQMNVQLANVISDLSGLTGQTIVRTIRGWLNSANFFGSASPARIVPTIVCPVSPPRSLTPLPN